MSGIACRNCGLEYAPTERVCPRCRLPRPHQPTSLDWWRDRRNRPTIIVGGLLLMMVIGFVAMIRMPSNSSAPSAVSQPPTESRPSGDDEGAKRELKKLAWVKDVYVSPGYMNVGVLRGEKQWNSPMIGNSVCGILKRFNSNLTYVRFVDIEQVADQQMSPRQAEIYSMPCR